jgi:DNA-3-methyladenine glycosylase II
VIDFEAALRHFEKADPVMAGAFKAYLAKAPLPRTITKADPHEYAYHLYSSIISQQISTKAADAILKRFLDFVGDPYDPQNILQYDIEELRTVGLSRSKAMYIRSIAELTSNGTVQLDHLDSLSDQEIIDELVLIKGVGVWTAEMFLMFTLGRHDVFSAGDLGLLNAVKKLYGKPNLTKDQLFKMSKKWSPHRTAASLVLWDTLDNKPAA